MKTEAITRQNSRTASACARVKPFDFRPKPPYLPKPQQAPRKEAVTIVIGFRCVDGIVICADQQITAAGAFKYHEPKISAEDFETFTAVFAYAGLPGLAQEVHNKVCAVLHNTSIEAAVIGSVREIAESVLSDMGRLYTDLQLQMLIGVNSWQEGAELLKFDGKAVHVARHFECLAFGDSSLVRFLAEKLYARTLDVKAGMDLAIYLVKKAEDYIDGCGGPIDVAALEPTDRSYRRLSQSFIQQRIAKMEAQEKLLTGLLIQKPLSST